MVFPNIIQVNCYEYRMLQLAYITFTGYLCFTAFILKFNYHIKAIFNMSSSYLSNLVSIKLCSVIPLEQILHYFWSVPRGPRGPLGARSFYAAAPTILMWNSLPANIREITSLSIFKKKLKTSFNLAYNE